MQVHRRHQQHRVVMGQDQGSFAGEEEGPVNGSGLLVGADGLVVVEEHRCEKGEQAVRADFNGIVRVESRESQQQQCREANPCASPPAPEQQREQRARREQE